MPLISQSTYRSPPILFSSHLQTIIPAGLRKVFPVVHSIRERVSTPDGDFLDIDITQNANRRVAIISHGLEGSSTRPYVLGMSNALAKNGWDVIAWNYRGCSGELNTNMRLYHSGATDDLETIVMLAKAKGYSEIALIGFSLGGNLTLKYLGEGVTIKPKEVVGAVVFSAPLDLHACSIQINRRENFIYSARFMKSLKAKIKAKSVQYPGSIDVKPLVRMKTVFDIDEHYTAPIHGFASALDYYLKCSSIGFVDKIKVPTLVVNALNDPFLAGECFSHSHFKELADTYLELPKSGGHCGFALYSNNGMYWSESRAVSFLQSECYK